MIALVTSSATKRISTLGGAPSPETPGKPVGAPAARGARRRMIGVGAASSGEARARGRRSGRHRSRRVSEMLRGADQRLLGAGDRRAAVAAAVDRVERRGEVPRLGVLREVDEDALAAVDVHVQLLDQPPDDLHVLLARVDHQRVGAALGHDQRPLAGRPLRCRPGRARAAGRGGGGGTAGAAAGSRPGAAAPTRPLAKSWATIWASSWASACLRAMIWSSLRATSTSTSCSISSSRRMLAGGVGQDQQVRLAMGGDRPLRGHEGTQQRRPRPAR